MLEYVLAGMALGAIYAIPSASLVGAYESAGVLNLAFVLLAYVVARFFYYLNTEPGWSRPAAGAASLLVVPPLMGVLLYAVLFRHLRGKSALPRLVAALGLSVGLPPL